MRKRIAAARASAGLAALAVFCMMPAGFFCLGLAGFAQTSEKPQFEVASIKPVVPDSESGPIPLAPGVTPGGELRSRVSIFNLICWAYRVDGPQVFGGPGWVRTDRYSIDAKPAQSVPVSESQTNITRERVKALLADRFHLVIRAETKEASVYVLTVAKGGPRLAPSVESGGVSLGSGVIQSPGSPISFLTVALTQRLGQQVLDQTGLDGLFRYKVEFKPDSAEEKRALALQGQPLADDDPRPSIFTALRSQLGLELQSRKGPVPEIVIERIERPTGN